MDTNQEGRCKNKKPKLSGDEALSEQQKPWNSLPAVVLGKVAAYLEPQDAMRFRTCNRKVKKECDAFLYRNSVEQLKESPVRYSREFFCDNCATIALGRLGDGQLEYRNEAAAIDFALKNNHFEGQVDTMAQAADDLAKK